MPLTIQYLLLLKLLSAELMDNQAHENGIKAILGNEVYQMIFRNLIILAIFQAMYCSSKSIRMLTVPSYIFELFWSLLYLFQTAELQ